MPDSLLLVGCGKMGAALLQGWLKAGICRNITVLEPNALPPELENKKEIKHIRDAGALKSLQEPPQVAILAVKPQIMEAVCPPLAEYLPAQTLILSIAAGKTLAAYERHFHAPAPVIRTMPNTPAAIGKGATVAIGNTHMTPDHKKTAETLLKNSGDVHWIDDETLMDAVTALSGSGPAYLFYLIEVLAQAGTTIGLPANLARDLARQTVIGAASLAETEKDTEAATLRQNVTSPGGTTEAALKILMNGDMQTLFNKALTAAQTRGRELSS